MFGWIWLFSRVNHRHKECLIENRLFLTGTSPLESATGDFRLAPRSDLGVEDHVAGGAGDFQLPLLGQLPHHVVVNGLGHGVHLLALWCQRLRGLLHRWRLQHTVTREVKVKVSALGRSSRRHVT